MIDIIKDVIYCLAVIVLTGTSATYLINKVKTALKEKAVESFKGLYAAATTAVSATEQLALNRKNKTQLVPWSSKEKLEVAMSLLKKQMEFICPGETLPSEEVMKSTIERIIYTINSQKPSIPPGIARIMHQMEKKENENPATTE